MTTILDRDERSADPDSQTDLGDRAAALARLRDVHRTSSERVAVLDLDDGRLWTRVGPWVSAIVRAAYELSATVRGEVPEQTATGVPPVVRARELGYAQGRLFEDLGQHPGVSSRVLLASADQVARLLGRIAELHGHADA